MELPDFGLAKGFEEENVNKDMATSSVYVGDEASPHDGDDASLHTRPTSDVWTIPAT
jgi:hypothetical protein